METEDHDSFGDCREKSRGGNVVLLCAIRRAGSTQQMLESWRKMLWVLRKMFKTSAEGQGSENLLMYFNNISTVVRIHI